MSQFLQGVFIVATTGAFGLPIYEGFQRQSPFYVALFTLLAVLSFAMHCEETGICSPLAPRAMYRLQLTDLGLSYYLLGVMLLVVLEIKNETIGRVAMAVYAAGVTLRNVTDMKFNVVAAGVVATVLLVIDIFQHHRKFTPAWWRRLALIGAMTAVGGILFRLLKALWTVHGLWHMYYIVTCYLLLLAQRHKKKVPVSGKVHGLGGRLAVAHSTATADGLAQSTPMKRKLADGGADVGPANV